MSTSHLLKERYDGAMDYRVYVQLIDQLLEKNQTTGQNQSEQMVEYTRLNRKRMSRVDKTVFLSSKMISALEELSQDIIWLVLTESWCGDAAINLPVLSKIAAASEHIDLRLVLRDENLDLMDEFLTNGARGIPKLIILNKESYQPIGTWGPRPKHAQKMVMDNKANPQKPYSEFVKDVQLWYAKDKGKTLQTEIIDLLEKVG